jgi:hypothetical protein
VEDRDVGVEVGDGGFEGFVGGRGPWKSFYIFHLFGCGL